MTIKEVSKKYNLSQDTIRYYEKIGLLPRIPRSENGIRNFDETSCKWIEFIKCMRDAGMEIEILLKYVTLFKKGKATIKQRKELLEEQRERLQDKQKKIGETLERLNFKIKMYEKMESGETDDKIWL